MERSAFVIACLLLTACTSQQTSQPLPSPVVTADTLQWHSTRLPVTQCQSNIVSAFYFELKDSGEWHSTIEIQNIDNHGRHPDWRNQISIEFQNGSKKVFTLQTCAEELRAASKQTFENTGKWNEGQEFFSDLKTAHIKINHQCEVI